MRGDEGSIACGGLPVASGQAARYAPAALRRAHGLAVLPDRRPGQARLSGGACSAKPTPSAEDRRGSRENSMFVPCEPVPEPDGQRATRSKLTASSNSCTARRQADERRDSADDLVLFTGRGPTPRAARRAGPPVGPDDGGSKAKIAAAAAGGRVCFCRANNGVVKLYAAEAEPPGSRPVAFDARMSSGSSTLATRCRFGSNAGCRNRWRSKAGGLSWSSRDGDLDRRRRIHV